MKINLPPIVISGTANSVTPDAYWPYDDGTGDPYWAGGSSPREYRWRINVTVTPQEHSSHLSRVPEVYNGIDIRPNMWIAARGSGIAVRIVSVESKTETTATLIVEDFLRYNTFLSQTASGIFGIPNTIVIFELNALGLPVVDPAPSGGYGPTFWSNLLSRFQRFTEGEFIIIDQENHGFKIEDIVSVGGDNTFTTPTTKSVLIGRVVDITSQDSFVIQPFSTVSEFNSLIGDIGDVLYYDSNTDEIVEYETSNPVYVKLRNHTLTSIVSSVPDANTSPTNSIRINGTVVTIGGTGAISDAVTAVNSETSTHDVTASEELAPLVVQSTAGFSLGEPAAYISNGPQISINGVIVTFTTDATGQATYGIDAGLEEDMAFDINTANIPNIEAQGSGNVLKIINTAGGTLELLNIKNDAMGNPMLSPNPSTPSCTGIVEGTYGPSTSFFLKLSKGDAGEIRLSNVIGNNSDILADFGVYSVENGIKARAIYIGQGVRKGDVYSVLDNIQREQLEVIVGDAAYVEDGGNGEWQYWLYTSQGWNIIATEDSARTDADVLSATIDYDSGSEIVIGTVSNNSRVANVTVNVIVPFNDGAASLNIGDSIDNTRVMPDSVIDLTEVGTYSFTPSFVYKDGGDTDIVAYLDAAGSTQGSFKVIVSYT